METSDVLLIAIPVLLGLAVLFVVATTLSRQRSSTGSFGREARKADKSGATDVVPASDLDEEARARYEETKRSLEPAGGAPTPTATAAGGLIRFGESPAEPEQVGVSRRMFFNRSIVTAQSLVLGTFGAAVIAFLWPAVSGGFGGTIRAGRRDEILDEIKATRTPFYVPDARSYLVTYPESAIPAAREVYPDVLMSGVEAGFVALSQKCPHLGCRVPWCLSSQWFECPCHGSKYNRVGEKKGGPAPRGMDRWPVEVDGNGNVSINTAGLVVQGAAIGVDTIGQEAEGPSCV